MPGKGGTGYAWLAFAAVPDADIRAELKAAHFRWVPRERQWEGCASNLPARYAPVPACAVR